MADFNGDGKLDLLWQHIAGPSPTGMVAIWYMDGTTMTSSTLTSPSGPSPSDWRIVATGDFNGDGHPDILWQYTDGTIAIWYMSGANLVNVVLTNPSNPGDTTWSIVDVGDFDGNGSLDFIWQQTGGSNPSGQVALWYMDYSQAAPTMTSAVLTNPNGPTPSDWRLAAVGNFNLVADTDADGLPDSWEMQYFGTLAWNRTSDPDGDGVNNGDEYAYGTNPAGVSPTKLNDFAGIKQQGEAGGSIADTMGAVGPNHFVTILNGDRSVAVYNKATGTRLDPLVDGFQHVSMGAFFTVTVPSGPYAGTYPQGPNDPRIIFDQLSQRWIASAFDSISQHVVLAVSNGPDPIGSGGASWVSDNWKKYLVTVATSQNDYDTLGVDSNGIYIAIRAASSNGSAMFRVAALPKAPFLDASAPMVQSNFILDVQGFSSPFVQPSVNLDAISISDPEWFVFNGGPVLEYNGLVWANGFTSAPVWLNSTTWNTLPITQSYDSGMGSIFAPQLGSSGTIALWEQGSTLMNAVTRKIGGVEYLWTCHQIGVNSSGNNDGNPADRSGIEWFKIQTSPSVSITASGRIYDSTTTNPKFYYMPSLTANKLGDIVIGFSGSSVNDHIGAYYSALSHTASIPSAPILYYNGVDWFQGDRWGDYSFTNLDPDGLTIWTIQQYPETRYLTGNMQNAWGTRIAKIAPF